MILSHSNFHCKHRPLAVYKRELHWTIMKKTPRDRDTAKPGLWTGPWTGLVTTITNQLACVQATLGAGRAYTPGIVNGQNSESDSTYVYKQ